MVRPLIVLFTDEHSVGALGAREDLVEGEEFTGLGLEVDEAIGIALKVGSFDVGRARVRGNGPLAFERNDL